MIKNTKPLMLVSTFLLVVLNACDGNLASEIAGSGVTNETATNINTNEETTPNTINSANLEALGSAIFFDTNLSNPPGQSCASCHAESVAFSDPDTHFPTSEGAVAARFGNRNSPTASYSAFIPPRRFDARRNRIVGGLFLDGRADSLEEQALGPFLNPLEMNNQDGDAVVELVRQAFYADQFEQVFGEGALDQTTSAFIQIGDALAAFERSSIFSPFSSKFDRLQNGAVTFTASEQRGLNLFNGRGECSTCHTTRPNPAGLVMLTNFEYENIGVPANPDNPFYQNAADFNPEGANFIDIGLGSTTNDPRDNGKFRTPTLRNVAMTAPYMHNGVFNTLEEVVEFYNRRDVNPNQAPPEVAENISNVRIGNLRLSNRDSQDLVAFMRTLTD